MPEVFIDTDVILDLLMQREPFYKFSARLFSLADRQEIVACISSLCFNNLDYLLSKQYGRSESRRILSQFKQLVTVLAVDDRVISLALNSPFADFEDAIQHFTATEQHIPVIITRNLKDYKQSAVPVMTAETFLTHK